MSVVTSNPFALLDDDSPAAAPATKKAAAPAAAEAPKRGTDPKRGGPAARSGRYPGRGGGAKPAARSDDVKNEDASEAPKRFDGEKARRGYTRGRGEGRGGDGRGRGRGRGGPRGDRPDRHSATGIVDSDKKLHQGWGGDTGDGEQLAEAQGAADAAAATGDWSGGAAEPSGWDAPAGEATGDAAAAPAAENGESEAKKAYRERRAREDEEDANLTTFEEYRKTQTTGLEELVPKLAAREANDGKDDSALFKGAKKLSKDEDEDSYFVGKTKAGPRARTQKEAKQTIEIDGRFDRPSRGGGESRGGRGAGRGRGGGEYRGGGEGRGRGRGAPRGGAAPRSSAPQAVNVDDANAFPSLS